MHTRKQSKAIQGPVDQRTQIRLPSHLWILFFMLLLSISPNHCSGACATTYLQSCPCLHPNPVSLAHTVTLSFNLSQCLEPNPSVLLLPPPPQRSCHNRKWSSKAPLMYASNCLQKAIARTVRMGQLGSGTYQESLT